MGGIKVISGNLSNLSINIKNKRITYKLIGETKSRSFQFKKGLFGDEAYDSMSEEDVFLGGVLCNLMTGKMKLSMSVSAKYRYASVHTQWVLQDIGEPEDLMKTYIQMVKGELSKEDRNRKRAFKEVLEFFKGCLLESDRPPVQESLYINHIKRYVRLDDKGSVMYLGEPYKYNSFKEFKVTLFSVMLLEKGMRNNLI